MRPLSYLVNGELGDGDTANSGSFACVVSVFSLCLIQSIAFGQLGQFNSLHFDSCTIFMHEHTDTLSAWLKPSSLDIPLCLCPSNKIAFIFIFHQTRVLHSDPISSNKTTPKGFSLLL